MLVKKIDIINFLNFLNSENKNEKISNSIKEMNRYLNQKKFNNYTDDSLIVYPGWDSEALIGYIFNTSRDVKPIFQFNRKKYCDLMPYYKQYLRNKKIEECLKYE